MRIIKFFPFIFLALFFVYLIDRVLLLDVSQNSLNLKSNPDLEKIKSPRPPVYLTSYADGDEIYFRNQNALALSALGKGVDHILNYRRSLLDPIFINQNKTIMDTAHGAGLWLWKPYIILETMKKAPEGAIIIYSDTGFIFKKEISDLLEKLKNQDIVIVECSKTIDGTVRSRVQKQTLNLMGVSDTSNLLDKNLMWAAFCMFKNSKKSRAFVQSWFDHASDPRKLMSHQDPLQPEDPSF